jgi:adenylate cyclase
MTPPPEDTTGVARRASVVLSADGKDYSLLMGEDEVGTVRTLTAHRAVMRDVIDRLHGRVVDSPGDNLLAEFARPVDAVASALEIQRALREGNDRLPEGRRLEFRIGVNAGDVVVDGERIYGDTVNIAARLEALADAGGLCVSGTVFDEVAHQLPVRWECLGEQALKNIARPVRTYRALLTPTRAARREPSRRPASRPSIAVLPFREFGAAETQQYFGDGVVEDIISALSSFPDLVVISRTSTSRYREGAMDVQTVGEELAVRYVLSGSVRRGGDRIRITAELADVESRTVLWTDKIEGPGDQPFDLQDQLAERTVTTIAPHVQNAEIRRALRKRPDSLDAYDLMLRGLDLLYQPDRERFERARAMFDQAIALDPLYAAPYAYSAMWHTIRREQGWSEDSAADREAVSRFAEAALERDPFDARALAICGHYRAFLFRDYERAFALFDRALARSPNLALAWIRSSPAYSYVGDGAEAARRAEFGLRLSPFDPHIFFTYAALCLAHYTRGAFREASQWGGKAMAAHPSFTATLRLLAASMAAEGDLDGARAVGRQLLSVEPGFRVEPFCAGYAYRDPARRRDMAQHLHAAGLPG